MAPPPPPKKHHFTLLFLFLLLIIFTLLLFSHYTLTPSSPPLQTTPPHFLSQQNHTFTFTIKLLAYDRLSSLTRCLNSLSSAYYSNDTVHLHIYIDHFPNSSFPSDVGQKLESFRQILSFVDGFEWLHGVKLIHYRTSNVGLQAQWLEAWWPVNDHDFVFVVEDDLEVSPFYYLFLKRLILFYYYDQDNFSPWIFGASLQRPRFVPGKHGNKMNLDSESKLFLYQLVGTWGQLLFPRPWKEFRLWYDDHKARGIKPFLEGMVTDGWYKKMGERIWTPWFIKFIHSHNYFNIYTNFPRERALTVSHRDAGVNYGKTAGPDSELLDENSHDIDLVNMKPLSDIRWYDFCFRKVLPGRVIKVLDDVGSIIQTMELQKPILLVSVSQASEKAVNNLICHFERLNIRNYIFIVPQRKSDLLRDLPRRGHPVILTESFFDSITGDKNSRHELICETVVQAYVIKKCLESWFDTWVISGNMLPLTNNPLLDTGDRTTDFYVGKGSRHFAVRISSSSRNFWGDGFVQRLADRMDRMDLVGRYGESFGDVIERYFENIGIRLTIVDDTGMSLKLETADVNKSVSTSTKMITWSPSTNADIVRDRLQQLGMWVIDGDSSCKAVVCHQS